MDYTSIAGSMAGLLTTIAFIPQVIQVVKTKSTKDISLGMFSIFALGVLCWLTYGVLLNSIPMIVSNGIIFILASVILGYKLKYK